MLVKPTVKNKFGYKKEEQLNPGMGFLSFQRFEDDPIYSDCIVKPQNNMCETENYECYPVSADVECNGNEQGFYPKSSLAYFRFLWKEFEPVQGNYNYGFIEEILEKAQRKGQQVVFRIMAHSTRARDDVPEWLKELIECPERPDGKRVKDSPTDPKFVELFLEAVTKLGEQIDGDYRLYAVDISLPGAWGEGHNLEHYGKDIYDRIIDVYTSSFSHTLLFGQGSRPELVAKASEKVLTGWRGDGFGNPAHIEKIYPERVEKMKDNWKTAPVSFESYWWLGEWKRQGWNIDALIEKSLEWHISSFNGKSMPIPFEWRDKIDYWLSKMGYHFMIESFAFPEKVSLGDTAECELCIDNLGVAPFYSQRRLTFRFAGNGLEYDIHTNVDIRKWMPGKTKEIILLDIPSFIKPGRYDIKIVVWADYVPGVYFCTDAPQKGGVVTLGSMVI